MPDTPDQARSLAIPDLRVAIEEAARVCKISRSQIYKEIKAGKLPVKIAAGRRYILAADLWTYYLQMQIGE